MLTDYGADTLRVASSPEPMHLCSRISRRPHPKHFAQALQDPLPDSINVNLNWTGVFNLYASHDRTGQGP